MKLKGGVLIIGSLYWQDFRDEEGDNIRKNWRDDRLDMIKVRDVKVPIRYGRLSELNGKVYTLVFDLSLSKSDYGNSKFVPFEREYFKGVNEILDEARELSNAEGSGKLLVKGIKNEKKDPWCICSILINANKIGETESQKLREKWKKALEATPDEHEVLPGLKERLTEYGLNAHYELQIDWPTELEEYDFLLCTSTKPEENASVEKIAKNVFNRPYFFANLAHGIKTHQDQDIIDELEKIRKDEAIAKENRLFSYCIPVDDGAAPNPYFELCTLAICKPVIRRVAKVGDWVAGVGAMNVNGKDYSGRLVYAMKISQIESMETYDEICRSDWNHKIPDMTSSDSRRWVGDCIYDFSKESNEPVLRNSVHKEGNRCTDLNGKNVLISDEFYYFGENAIHIPEHLHGIIKQGQAHKSNANDHLKNAFIEFIRNSGFEKNVLYGKPQLPYRVGAVSECDSAKQRSTCAEEDLEIEKLKQ
jgi:hypothetical protein